MKIGESTFALASAALISTFAVLMGLSFYFVEQERSSQVQLDLESQSANLARATSEILRLSVENLRAASSIITFVEDINYQQFQDLTERYFSNDPGLLIMEWQPVVSGENRQQFEQSARARGIPSFRLWEPDDQDNPIAAQARDEHVPVYLMRSRYPQSEDINTLGLDLAWSVERMTSKWQARDEGRAISSGFFPVLLGRDNTNSPLGFAITLPIYRNGIIPDTLEGRQQQLLGYLAGVYSVRMLLDEKLGILSERGVSVEIADDADAAISLSVKNGEPSSFDRVIETSLYGNSWHIRLTATEKFVDERFDPMWYALTLGLILLFLITIFFLSLQEKSKKNLRQAHQALSVANRKLTELSRHDPLTGLLNRRAFLERMAQTLDELERDSRPAALLMIDLDWFKSINDKWGHATGDKVLQAFASICSKVSRRIDSVGRLGGEEFAILLPNTDLEQARLFAERLREIISSTSVDADDSNSQVTFTASIGVAVTTQHKTREVWMAEADKALYFAKEAGRNQVSEFVLGEM